jgi:hypothetical protein
MSLVLDYEQKESKHRTFIHDILTLISPKLSTM